MLHVTKVVVTSVLLVGLTSGLASAAPIWSLDFDAFGGDVSGPPGTTVGWGYTIVNNAPDYWLSITAMDADPFQHGTVDPFVFDFPILAPGQSLSVSYDGIVGLLAFTWDITAPPGFVNAGSVWLEAEFYDGDPLFGGALIEAAPTLSVDYTATVWAQAVAEPSPALLLAVALLALYLFRRPAV